MYQNKTEGKKKKSARDYKGMVTLHLTPVTIVMRSYRDAENVLKKNSSVGEIISATLNLQRIVAKFRDKIKKQDKAALEQILMMRHNAEVLGYLAERKKNIKWSYFKTLALFFKNLPNDIWEKDFPIMKRYVYTQA